MNSLTALLTASAPPAIDTGGAWLLWTIGGAVIALSAGFAYMGRVAMGAADGDRRDAPMDAQPLEPNPSMSMDRIDARAFAALTRRRRLSRAQRNTLKRLAHDSGIPAPALLISENAFDAAASRIRNAGRCDEPQDRFIHTLRARIFAGS